METFSILHQLHLPMKEIKLKWVTMTLIIHNNPGGHRTVTFGNKFKFRGNVNHTWC